MQQEVPSDIMYLSLSQQTIRTEPGLYPTICTYHSLTDLSTDDRQLEHSDKI